MCFIEHDLSKWVVLYISSSYKDIIANRAYIFGDGFNTYIKAIYAHSALKKMYAKFFIEFWEMPEIQKTNQLILDIFCNYEPFRKDMLHKSIYHDDDKLFAKCVSLEKDNKHVIISTVRKYSAWNILATLNEYPQFKPVDGNVANALIREKNGKIALKDVFAVNDLTSNKVWRLEGIYQYYDYYIDMQYVRSDLDKMTPDAYSNKYEFYTHTRNLLKYILTRREKNSDLDMHCFFMQHNNFSFIYEYFNAAFAGGEILKNIASSNGGGNGDGDNKNEGPTNIACSVINILLGKIKKNRNILITLFKYKYLIVALYEREPSAIFRYFIKNYDKLRPNNALFLLETVFDDHHRAGFYKVISTCFEGRMSKKARKCLYEAVKTPSHIFRSVYLHNR